MLVKWLILPAGNTRKIAYSARNSASTSKFCSNICLVAEKIPFLERIFASLNGCHAEQTCNLSCTISLTLVEMVKFLTQDFLFLTFFCMLKFFTTIMHIIAVTYLLPVSVKLLNFCSENALFCRQNARLKVRLSLLEISADKIYPNLMLTSLFPGLISRPISLGN